MDSKEFIAEINRKIGERSILKHPFYQDWKSGRLTRKMLQIYAKQYYIHVVAFPRYLSNIHSKITDFKDRTLILQNLMDEEYGNKNHPGLWLQFCEALGLSKDEVGKTLPAKETSQFVNHFLNAGNKGIPQGIAALYTYEYQIPKVSHEKIKGLINFYSVDKEGLEYFKVHEQADIEHSRAEMELLLKHTKPQEAKEVFKIVDKTLDAYWNMLSGIRQLCLQA